MTIGGKYKFVADSNPAPGQYSPSHSLVKSTSKMAIIREDAGYKVPREAAPAPGQYDSHLQPFGTNDRQMTIGGKYKFVTDSNPAPGQYDPSSELIKSRSVAAKIQLPASPKREPDYMPGPGDTGLMTSFGNPSGGVYMGEKWKTRIEQTPGPGDYDNMESKNFTKQRTLGGKINADTMIEVSAASLAGN